MDFACGFYLLCKYQYLLLLRYLMAMASSLIQHQADFEYLYSYRLLHKKTGVISSFNVALRAAFFNISKGIGSSSRNNSNIRSSDSANFRSSVAEL